MKVNLNDILLYRNSEQYKRHQLAMLQAAKASQEVEPPKVSPAPQSVTLPYLIATHERREAAFRAKYPSKNYTEEEKQALRAPPLPSSDPIERAVKAALEELEAGQGALENPRCGNTGNTLKDPIRTRMDAFESAPLEAPSELRRAIQKSQEIDWQGVKMFVERLASNASSKYTKADWLSLSFPQVDDIEANQLYNEFADLLEESRLEVKPRRHGMHGYSSSAEIVYMSEVAGSYKNVGQIAWGRQGFLFELSGLGCEATRPRHIDIAQIAVGRGGRITRLDLAADFDGIYCNSTGLTVPKIMRDAVRGKLKSKYSAAHIQQTIKPEGEWGGFITGDMDIDAYDPEKDCPKGLTAYIGANTSENQLVAYEKGKQLLGSVDKEKFLKIKQSLDAEVNLKKRSYLVKELEKCSYNPEFESSKSWVRIERRIRRGGNKKDISIAQFLDTDAAFVSGYDELERLLQDYAAYLDGQYVTWQEYRAKSAARQEVLLLSKKVFWGQRQYGRLVKTLQDQGYTASEIVDMLTRSQGLKDVIFDLLSE